MKMKRRFKKLIKSAKKRGISVELNIVRYQHLIEHGCTYCGKSLMEEEGYSIDRIDAYEGYTYENSWGCCGTCNRAKGQMSHIEFLTWMRYLFEHQRRLHDYEINIGLPSKKEVRKIDNKFKNSSAYRNAEMVVIEGTRNKK